MDMNVSKLKITRKERYTYAISRYTSVVEMTVPWVYENIVCRY